MKREQPLRLALIEEVLFFLAFVGLGTIVWLAKGIQTDWWRGAIPEIASAYAVRFSVELWLKYRKKPLLRLMPDDYGAETRQTL